MAVPAKRLVALVATLVALSELALWPAVAASHPVAQEVLVKKYQERILKDEEEFVRSGTREDVPLLSDSEAGLALDQPQQVHIALAGPNKMRVTWLTPGGGTPSAVDFGVASGEYTRRAEGESLTYSYLGWRSGHIHHVVLGTDEEPLEDDRVYYYRCGGSGPELSFKTPPPAGPDTPVTYSVIGDLGQTGWSVTTLDHMAASPHDVVILAGDLSYADRYQPRWDSWGRLIQRLAATRPWMVVEGNHEIENVWGLEPEFKAYNARWRMPHNESKSPSNLFYSFEVGGVHWLMLGSYADFGPDSDQYRWLQEDLASVDRARTPWLIAVLHAPWYNSNTAHQREGDAMMAAIEPLLYGARVDLLFAGHVHAYERATRVYKGKPDPCGIMHITIGDGGNREGLASRYLDPQPDWSVRREASFGHGELRILNATSASWTWHRNQDDNAVIADDLEITSLSDPANGATCSAAAAPPGGQKLGRKEKLVVLAAQ